MQNYLAETDPRALNFRKHLNLFLFLLCVLGSFLLIGVAAQAEESSLVLLPPVVDSELGAIMPIAFNAPLFNAEEPTESLLSIEDRLANLEEKYTDRFNDYDKLKSRYKKLKKKLRTKAKPGHRGASMKINGRMHFDMWNFPNSSSGINRIETGDPLLTPQTQFNFRRLRFGVKGELWKTMLYRIEVDFAAGNKWEFRDAYFGWEDLPVFQKLLIGNQQRPYGMNYLYSSRYTTFLERPYIIEATNQDTRRMGIQSIGSSEDRTWNWRYGLFNLQLVQNDGNYTSDHWQLEMAGRLCKTFWYDEASDGRGYGHFGVSGSLANPDGTGGGNRAANEARFRNRPEGRSINRWLNTGRIQGVEDYQLLGLENAWNFGALHIASEYQSVWLQRDASSGPDLNFNGAYISVSYFLTGEYIPWKRGVGTIGRIRPLENFFLVDTCNDGIQGGWGAWQVGYRWSYADFNDDNIFGGRGKSHSLALNWLWSPYARVQFNATYGEIDDAQVSRGINTGVEPLSSGNYTILGTRLMLDF